MAISTIETPITLLIAVITVLLAGEQQKVASIYHLR